MSEKETESENLLAYFRRFFSDAPRPWRVVIIAYFVIFLFTPLYGLPTEGGNEPASSGLLAFSIIVVLVLSLIAVILFNLSVSQRGLRRAGRVALFMMATPLIVIVVSALLALVLGTVPAWVLRAMTSVAMVVPLSLVVVVQVESVVERGSRANTRLPFLLAMVSVFLIIYTFATFYYLNGLIMKTTGGALSFADALYESGLAFTTLGLSEALPIGFGKALIVFESISGFLVLSLLTAIFLQYIMRPRE
jgi:hypothetical protein